MLSIFEGNNWIYYIWLFASFLVIYSIFNVIRNYELFSSYVISLAPSVIVLFCFYEAITKNSSLLTMTVFVCLLLLSLKYGWRISRIVAWQRYTGDYENYNIKKEKA